MKELKIENLSIGDWVNYKGESFSIDGVNIEMVSQNCRIIGFQEMAVLRIGALKAINVKVRDLTPIPITPEILEKNGVALAEDYDEYSALYTCPQLSIVKYRNGYVFDTPQARVHIEHVHELQHAIRLAGVGKEVVL